MRSSWRKFGRQGQATFLEFATLVVVLVAALVTMALYVKRALSGRLRDTAESIGDQYAPRQTTSIFTVTAKSRITSESNLMLDQVRGGKPVDLIESRTTIQEDTTNRIGNEQVGPLGSRLWD